MWYALTLPRLKAGNSRFNAAAQGVGLVFACVFPAWGILRVRTNRLSPQVSHQLRERLTSRCAPPRQDKRTAKGMFSQAKTAAFVPAPKREVVSRRRSIKKSKKNCEVGKTGFIICILVGILLRRFLCVMPLRSGLRVLLSSSHGHT